MKFDQAAAILRELEDGVDLIECDRSMSGHSWFRVDDPGTWQPDRRFFTRKVRRCLRCMAWRFQGISAYGEIESTWYDYPDGWEDRWGVGNQRPLGDEIRMVHIVDKEREMRRGT